MGIEMDKQVCDTAEANLSGVATNVKVELVTKDCEELSKYDFAPC